MDNLRLFIGIPLPSGLIDRLAAIMSRLKTDLPFRKWTHPEDLHITLHFLFDTPTNRVDEVRADLAAVAAAATPINLSITKPDTFGPSQAPRILWLGVAEPGNPGGLSQLHEALAPGLSRAGFKLDERPFRSHLTLARQGGAGCGSEAIQAAWQSAATTVLSTESSSDIADSLPLSWTTDRITLFRSHLGRRPSYEKIGEALFRSNSSGIHD